MLIDLTDLHTVKYNVQLDSVPLLFSKSISQTKTFWELGIGSIGIRVILRGKLGIYSRSKVLEKWSWRSGT